MPNPNSTVLIKQKLDDFRIKLLNSTPMTKMEYELLVKDDDIKGYVDVLVNSGVRLLFNDKNEIVLNQNTEILFLLDLAKNNLETELKSKVAELKNVADQLKADLNKDAAPLISKDLIISIVSILPVIIFICYLILTEIDFNKKLIGIVTTLLISVAMMTMLYDRKTERSNDRIEWRSRMTLGVVMILSAVALVTVYFFKS